MFESIAIGLITSGLSKGVGVSTEKVRRAIRYREYSDDVDPIAIEFTKELRKDVESSLDENGFQVQKNLDWVVVADELENLDWAFETEEEAVISITNAIRSGLNIKLQTNPALKNSLEIAVADAYESAIRQLVDNIAGTDLADNLNTQLNIQSVTTLRSVQHRIQEIQQELESRKATELRDTGFSTLDSIYFERKEPAEPEIAWRTGFDLAEVWEGLPLRRQRPSGDEEERKGIVSEVIELIAEGDDTIVLGEGGSGKSTICKQVACEWLKTKAPSSTEAALMWPHLRNQGH